MCIGFTASHSATIEKTELDAVCKNIVLKKMCFMKIWNPLNEELNFITNTKIFRDEIIYLGLIEGSISKQLSSEIFKAYENLQILILEGAQITEIIPETFKDAHNLKHLSFEYNEIHSLESSTFNGAERLESLDLSFNQIENLPVGIFRNLTKLNELLISGNNMKNLDVTTFSSLTQLSLLSLGNKLIELSPKLFSENHEIEYLNLMNNELTNDVYEAIKHLDKLKYLDLSGNKLTELESFNYPESVEYLYVTDNKITKIFINKNVVKIRAPGNPIMEISGSTFDKLTEFFLDSEIMLQNFGEIDMYINLRLLGNETDPMLLNNVVRSFLRHHLTLLKI